MSWLDGFRKRKGEAKHEERVQMFDAATGALRPSQSAN